MSYTYQVKNEIIKKGGYSKRKDCRTAWDT